MRIEGIYRLETAGREIPIEIQYGFRKRLTLTVYPDRRVIARIPYGLSQKKVKDYLVKKSGWMIKHLDHFEQHPPENDKQYVDGESFEYLGSSITLCLSEGPARIMLQGNRLLVQTRNTQDKVAVESALSRWYRRNAVDIMTQRFWKIFNELRHWDLPETSLRFYKMKRGWASCSMKHVITLNTGLIKKDPALIDYVIIHEICHLKVPAHNKAFYSLMASVLPDWKERRKKLNDHSL